MAIGAPFGEKRGTIGSNGMWKSTRHFRDGQPAFRTANNGHSLSSLTLYRPIFLLLLWPLFNRNMVKLCCCCIIANIIIIIIKSSKYLDSIVVCIDSWCGIRPLSPPLAVRFHLPKKGRDLRERGNPLKMKWAIVLTSI